MSTRAGVTGLLAGGALLFAGGAAAQVSGTLDVGAGTYRPERAIPGGVASIAPTVYLDAAHYRLGASGVYTDAPAGRWNFQGAGMGQVRSPEIGPLQLEATGQIEFTRHYSARGVTAATAELRGYVRPLRGTTLWLGRAGGSVTSLGARRPLSRQLYGASTRVGGVEVGLSVSSSTFELFGTALAGQTPRTDSIAGAPTLPQQADGNNLTRRMSMTDALVSTRWRLIGTDLDLAVGRRFGRNTPQLTIWGVSASRGVTPNLSLVAGAGRSGSDPITAVPGSSYLVLGLRLRVGGSAQQSIGPAPTAAVEHARFRIGPALPAGREVIVVAPGADRVELAGDFTDWRPVPLQYAGVGGWRTVLPISSGLHRLAVRIDGGAWQAAPGSRPIRNEFGVEVTEVVLD
ncbi:MAG TPA: glycogen-binding domain-containing protein [Gemmatimonadales bacterium]|nr:glycogen-binding domain-containing protein [Gemmatimonadales bacterium]